MMEKNDTHRPAETNAHEEQTEQASTAWSAESLIAHRRAALAVQEVISRYIRARLFACTGRQYASLSSSQAARLCWLIDSSSWLFGIVDGAQPLDIATCRRRLAELDAAVGPGTQWDYVAGCDDETTALRSSELPDFLATYDASFVGSDVGEC